MSNPHFASDGHTYDRHCINQWFEKNSTSPITGSELTDKKLTPNFNLRSAIAAYVDPILHPPPSAPPPLADDGAGIGSGVGLSLAIV